MSDLVNRKTATFGQVWAEDADRNALLTVEHDVNEHEVQITPRGIDEYIESGQITLTPDEADHLAKALRRAARKARR